MLRITQTAPFKRIDGQIRFSFPVNLCVSTTVSKVLTRSAKALLTAKATKQTLPPRDVEYCDGQCKQVSVGKKQIATPKAKKPSKKQSCMTTTHDPVNTADPLQTEGEQAIVNTTATMPLTFEDVSKLLADQNDHHASQWQQQMNALTKTFEKSQTKVPLSGSNSIKFPTFSGDTSADVNDFIRQLNLTAAFYNLNNLQKADMLPLLLTGNASVWFTASTHLTGKPYDQLCKSLTEQFQTEADSWLLRQQLLNRKQLASETVAQFASEIRKLCQRLKIPDEESINYLLNGFRPELKNYVILQRPKTFAQAETHGKLREALPQEKPDRTDEILLALSRLKSTKEPQVAAYNVPFTNSHTPRVNYQQDKPLGRDEITQIIRQELRRSFTQQTQGQDYRNRRTFDGRPICNYCQKTGHIAYVCRKRQFDNRDPRIPTPRDERTEQNRGPGGNQANPAPFNRQPLN